MKKQSEKNQILRKQDFFMVTKEIIVRGKVQGVFFRASAKEAADKLGLTGRVKNLPDGAVWLVVSGPEEQVNKMTAWCKDGPRRARVDELIIHEIATPGYSDFQIERE